MRPITHDGFNFCSHSHLTIHEICIPLHPIEYEVGRDPAKFAPLTSFTVKLFCPLPMMLSRCGMLPRVLRGYLKIIDKLKKQVSCIKPWRED